MYVTLYCGHGINIHQFTNLQTPAILTVLILSSYHKVPIYANNYVTIHSACYIVVHTDITCS